MTAFDKDKITLSRKVIPNNCLRQARETRGWTQREVADAIGTTALAVGRWERGERRPQRFYWGKLCELFGTNAVELGLLPNSATKEAVSK